MVINASHEQRGDTAVSLEERGFAYHMGYINKYYSSVG